MVRRLGLWPVLDVVVLCNVACQANPIAGNLVADPQFVDYANGDFRLKAGSPAIDAAVPSPGLSTLHDFVGTRRPQGAAHDIGAFELVP